MTDEGNGVYPAFLDLLRARRSFFRAELVLVASNYPSNPPADIYLVGFTALTQDGMRIKLRSLNFQWPHDFEDDAEDTSLGICRGGLKSRDELELIPHVHRSKSVSAFQGRTRQEQFLTAPLIFQPNPGLGQSSGICRWPEMCMVECPSSLPVFTDFCSLANAILLCWKSVPLGRIAFPDSGDRDSALWAARARVEYVDFSVTAMLFLLKRGIKDTASPSPSSS
ncbi:hypothetical protein K438DRAFT_1766842 [Mycena galopus ATCC 62051]|nr:hypothetical protein K438DRAFT_1766842 [Mycena galopus ATCC 62051]